LYSYVRDRWGIFYQQPIVLNERAVGVAVEGIVQHNHAEDRIRVHGRDRPVLRLAIDRF